jgi:hypothetical protein
MARHKAAPAASRFLHQGPSLEAARYRRGYRDFDIWGAPEQADGLFMLVRFDLDPHDVGDEALLPAGTRWVRLSEAGLAEFADDDP